MTAIYKNVGDVPLALAVFLASDYYDYSSESNEISATTLLKPLRQVILPSRIPLGEAPVDLAAMMASRMGAAIHDSIEKAWTTNHVNAMRALGYARRVIERIRVNPKPDELTEDTIPVYLEQRLKRSIVVDGKTWVVTGKFDFVGEGRVQDFKSTSVWTYMNQVNNDKYTWQGSIYRWLGPNIITQDELDIHYIFTDWKAGMQRSDPNYPPRRFHKQVFPLESVQATQAFIERKLRQVNEHWDADERDLPPCTDEELWRSEPVYKYYKKPENAHQPGKRSTKNFDTLHDARIRLIEDGNVGVVKEVPGQVTACKYCPAFPVCTQKDDLIASGDLLLG